MEKTKILIWILSILGTVLHSIYALRFIMLEVPSPTTSGENIELTCKYELEGDKLYSVKWYKNDEEFYRYVPADFPQAQSLPMPGVKVDLGRSNQQNVFLRNINLSTAGVYRCEVSAEAPEFTTIEEFKEMKVFVLPSEGPKISGSKPNYNVGSRVELNCTSAKSKPAAKLRWYINDEPAGPNYEIVYSNHTYPDGLETSMLGLKFIVGEQHFQSGNMKLKCTGTISRVYTMSNEATAIGGRQESSRIQLREPLNQATSSSVVSNRQQIFRAYQLFYSVLLPLVLWQHLYSKRLLF